MAVDEELAERIRDAVVGRGIEHDERRMFGGLAFLVNGNMAVAASGQGGIMVRADPEQVDELLATTDATQMEMRDRPMTGWLRVAAEHLDGDAVLDRWTGIGLARAQALPPK